MSFRIGQGVWIGWHPDSLCGAPRARCATGTIVAGPFPAGVYNGKERHAAQNWLVDCEAGEIRADEDVLFPIDDDPAPAEKADETLHV